MTTEKHELRYSGLFIPARLLYAAGMNCLDKYLLAMIEALSRRSAGCTATNAYLARECGVHEMTISKTVSRLGERGLLACSYAENSHRTIRITRAGICLFNADLEPGDDPEDGGSAESLRGVSEGLNRSTKHDKEEYIRARAAAAEEASNTQAGYAKTEYVARARDDDLDAAAADDGYEELLPRLKAIGCTEIQAAIIIQTSRKHGRNYGWLQGWLDEAGKRASNPGGFVHRMVRDNADLPIPDRAAPKPTRWGDPENQPVSPERRAQIDARANAEWERTRQSNSLDGYRKPTDDELEAAGWYSVKEQLRKRIETEGRSEHWGARPYKRPTEEERAKVREAKAELEAKAAARALPKEGPQDDQEGPRGPKVDPTAVEPELPPPLGGSGAVAGPGPL